MIASFINPWTISKLCAGSPGETAEIEFISGDRRLKASVPSDEFWGSVKDILVFEEYEILRQFSCPNLRGGIVVDVGAQVGLYTLKTAPFAQEVVSFEPSSKNFRFLKANVERNALQNARIHQKALWSTRGHVRFAEGGTGFVAEIGGTAGGYDVDTTTLEDVVTEVGKISLLKIDIEGAEYEVIPPCGESTLRQIEKIVAEVHVFAPDHINRLEGIIRQLRDAGFRIVMQRIPFQRMADGFVKPWESPLQSCNGKNILLYKALLSVVYGATPILRNLKGSIDIGTQSLLFAYRA